MIPQSYGLPPRPITVFIAGGFDLLTEGHVYLLTQARALGDRLIVGLNHDAYFARKGPGRPVDPFAERARKLYATGLIETVYQIEDDPLELIVRLKPDVIVTGDDYRPDQIVGYAECGAWGGRVQTIKRLPGISTTEVIKTRATKAAPDPREARRHNRYDQGVELD